MFRFTIRDVLWLMVVVGMSVGWWLNWRTWEQDRVEHANEIYKLELKTDRLQDELIGVHGFIPE